jgi:hypothetical protein
LDLTTISPASVLPGGVRQLSHYRYAHDVRGQQGQARRAADTRDVPIDKAAALARIQGLAKLMDSAVAIPGTDIRLGLDAAIGLVPVLGDLVSQAISSYIIWEARRLGVSRWTMARMISNTAIDAVVGMVPLVGDAFDVAFRANIKNLRLLEAHLAKQGIATTVARDFSGRPVIEGDYRRVD